MREWSNLLLRRFFNTVKQVRWCFCTLLPFDLQMQVNYSVLALLCWGLRLWSASGRFLQTETWLCYGVTGVTHSTHSIHGGSGEQSLDLHRNGSQPLVQIYGKDMGQDPNTGSRSLHGTHQHCSYTDQHLLYNFHQPLEDKLGVIRTSQHRAQNVLTRTEGKEKKKRHIKAALKTGPILAGPSSIPLGNPEETEGNRPKNRTLSCLILQGFLRSQGRLKKAFFAPFFKKRWQYIRSRACPDEIVQFHIDSSMAGEKGTN